MAKVLSRSGASLADVYDVEGSIAGIEQLETGELPIVHEMGGTVFSERLSANIRRNQAVALLQNVSFDITFVDFAEGISRILGVTVLASVVARVGRCQLSLRDPISGREIPFFIWDSLNNSESLIRIVENGGAAASQLALIGLFQTPNLQVGTGQPLRVGTEIVMRGNTLGFGAGAVTITGLVYIAFSQITGISSIGLPVPAW